MKNELKLVSGATQNWDGRANSLFLTLEFSDSEMTITLGPDGSDGKRWVSMLWSHTVYELEKLSEGLTYVALGSLPETYPVPSRDILIGPTVGLFPALWFQMGHPGIGMPGQGVMLYCWSKFNPLARRRLVDLEGTLEGRAMDATFEVDDVLDFAEDAYQVAKALEPKLMPSVSG